MQQTSFEYQVRTQDLALTIGSGGLEVLSTPALIAFMENAAWRLAQTELNEQEDTVGTFIQMKHIAACLEGSQVFVEAKLLDSKERKMSFELIAKSGDGKIYGEAIHDRFVINKESFMRKLKQ